MPLRPRHFVLLAILIGVFVFNIVQRNHRKKVELAELRQVNSLAAPAWDAFDKAAGLRDAPDAQFQPAFTALRNATEGPGTDAADIVQAQTDVRACKTWLVFYRTPSWRSNAKKHVDGCSQYHRDTIA
jgi:hypothetical protein